MPFHVIVLGGTLAGVRAARRLAAAGLAVTLLEPTPFLGSEALRDHSTWMSSVPDLLESTRDPHITVLTQANVEEITRQGDRFLLRVQEFPRYVDAARCTACGECETVCPVERIAGGNGHPRKAIYRDPAGRAVPNLYAIEKRGAPPCSHTCPGGIHVQGFVALIAQGKFAEAHQLITQAIPFPGICGRVCDHPCEQQCSRNELDKPVAMRALKRFVADYASKKGGLTWEKVDPDPSLPPIAVVGAGPAGLTVAWELARKGVRVTVFEALPMPGGMMVAGIPAYRLPRETLRQEIAAIESLGVEIRLNSPLGPDRTLDDLFAQGYGAVFLGLGAHRSRLLGIPGEELAGVVHATDFLREVSLAQEANEPDIPARLRQQGIEIGRRAVVIGGGNSAMDAARTLLRLGAEEVHILYRRSRREMPAIPEEITASEEEGIVVQMLVNPLRIVGEDGRVTAIECVRMALGEPDESGRARPLPVEGSEFTLDADMVVAAIGQETDPAGLPADLCTEGGLCVDPATGQTSRPGVFAGGDVVKPSSVIEAIGAGKRVASAILCYLRGEEVEAPAAVERPVARWSAEELAEQSRQARQEPATMSARKRRRTFAEVEKTFTPEQAVTEAGRCLSCAVCSECLQCVAICKPRAIDHSLQPRAHVLEADAVLFAGGYDLALPEGVLRLGAAEPERAAEALLGVSPRVEIRPAPLRRRTLPSKWLPARLGVLLCRCGEQIAGSVDLDALQKQVAGLPGVVRVEQVPFACLPEGATALREATADLDAAVLAACSCCNLAQVCYSCTTQRLRCRTGLGVWEDTAQPTLPPWAWEYVNLREHCAWVRDPAEALGTARDLISAAVARLTAGPAIPLVATVDAERCRTCGTCVSVCQAEALYLEPDEQGRLHTMVEVSRCRSCGICAAHCPTGALAAGRISDRQLEATLQALLGTSQESRALVFTCNWGGHSGAEAAGMNHRKLPAGVRVVRMPCVGRVSPGLLLQALEQGAAGVLLAGCPEEGCEYDFGRNLAAEALAQARALASLLGLGAERLEIAGFSPGDGAAFADAVNRFVSRLKVQGVPDATV